MLVSECVEFGQTQKSWFLLQKCLPGVTIGIYSCEKDSAIHQMQSALASIAELYTSDLNLPECRIYSSVDICDICFICEQRNSQQSEWPAQKCVLNEKTAIEGTRSSSYLRIFCDFQS